MPVVSSKFGNLLISSQLSRTLDTVVYDISATMMTGVIESFEKRWCGRSAPIFEFMRKTHLGNVSVLRTLQYLGHAVENNLDGSFARKTPPG